MLHFCETDCKIEQVCKLDKSCQKKRCQMVVLMEAIVLWSYDQI